MAPTRRDFLRHAACALGGLAAASSFESLGLVDAYAQSAGDYRALVCVFLNGGNDGNNMVVPLDDEGFNQYSGVRATSGLALQRASFLPVNPPGQGRTFGFHPSLAEVKGLFDAGKAAVLCNVGPLVEPLTRATYLSGAGKRPLQLFSHSDQVAVWQTSVAHEISRTGWGGRTADRVAGLNGASPFSQAVSIAGVNTFLRGDDTRQLAVADSNTPLAGLLTLDLNGPSSEWTSRRAAADQIRAAAVGNRLARADADARAAALQLSEQLRIPFRIFQTTFPNTTIGRQLLQVGRLIAERNRFQIKRQIFFTQLGGFDTHANQRAAGGQDTLLQQLSQALKAFYDLLVELGPALGTDVTREVTTFTLSDFGRTLEPSGSGAQVGTDHGWGNHHFIMGGAVRGGDFYGRFPVLALGGPDDADRRGRWIPTTSVEQYGATLATWYGLPPGDLPAVFPLLDRFPSANLGFML